jgi:hypothetical protein
MEEDGKTSDQASIEKTGKPEEPPKLSCFIYLLALMSTLGGFQCGYNTGNVSFKLFRVGNNRFDF